MSNDTQTLTLTDFLLARIAEDEEIAQAAWPTSWTADGRNSVETTETGLRGGYEGLRMGVANLAMTVGNYQAEARNATHIARHDPARVLAECEAKRRIVALQAADRPKVGAPPYNGPLNDPFGDAGRHPDFVAYVERHCEPVTDTPILRALALPYSDHPDYREEWKP